LPRLERKRVYSPSTSLSMVYLTFRPSLWVISSPASVSCLRWCDIEGCARSIISRMSAHCIQPLFLMACRMVSRVGSASAFEMRSISFAFRCKFINLHSVNLMAGLPVIFSCQLLFFSDDFCKSSYAVYKRGKQPYERAGKMGVSPPVHYGKG
jgi:hypothetical protein